METKSKTIKDAIQEFYNRNNFHDSFIYKGDNFKTGTLIHGGLLWVTNKILIDKLFDLNKSIQKHKSIINI